MVQAEYDFSGRPVRGRTLNMKTLILFLALAPAVMGGGVITANATVYTETTTVDANGFNIHYQTLPNLVLGNFSFTVPPANLGIGDEYSLTVNFLPGQSVTLSDPCFPGCADVLTFGDAALFPPPAVNNPYTVSLLGATGNGFTSAQGTCGDCFYGAINPVVISNITFTGLNFIGVANLPFITTGNEQINIEIGGILAGTITVNQTPEPASLSILVIGLIGLWLARRRIERALAAHAKRGRDARC